MCGYDLQAGRRSRSHRADAGEPARAAVQLGRVEALRGPAPLTTTDPDTHLGSGARPESGPADNSPAALAQALITLHAELDRIYHEAARQLRLTPQQAQLLCMCEPSPPSMGDLARMLNCDNSNITGLVAGWPDRAW